MRYLSIFTGLMALLSLSLNLMAAQAQDAPTKTVDVGENTLSYREIGDIANPPMVLFQRFRGNLDDWDPAFLNNLAEKRRLIIFNNAGVASSTGIPDNTIKGMSDNAAAFMKAINVERADILGWSMGGFVAQAFAIDHPDMVEKLILIGTGPAATPATPKPSEGVFDVATRPEYGEEERSYLFFADSPESHALARESMQRIDTARRPDEPLSSPDAMKAQAGAIEQYWFDPSTGYGEKLGTIKHPTLIISGDRDPFFNVDGQAALYNDLSSSEGVRLAVYPMTGHAPHHQYPQTVAAQIIELVE